MCKGNSNIWVWIAKDITTSKCDVQKKIQPLSLMFERYYNLWVGCTKNIPTSEIDVQKIFQPLILMCKIYPNC